VRFQRNTNDTFFPGHSEILLQQFPFRNCCCRISKEHDILWCARCKGGRNDAGRENDLLICKALLWQMTTYGVVKQKGRQRKLAGKMSECGLNKLPTANCLDFFLFATN
jgi:hypothetical protein